MRYTQIYDIIIGVRGIKMQIQQINEKNFRANDIQNGDVVLFGGSTWGKLNMGATIDVDAFKSFIDKLQSNVVNMTADTKTQSWLQKYAPEIDIRTFSAMYVFDNLLRRMYPNMSQNTKQRKLFYTPENRPKLSDAFNAGVCMCAEISLLAQISMQAMGIKSKYMCGETLDTAEMEFGDAHSFIQINIDGTEYFWDPANPIHRDGTYMPTMMRPNATPAQITMFEERARANDIQRGRRCCYMDSINILTGRHKFYGYGDGMNVFPEFLVGRDIQTMPPINQNGGMTI